MVIICPQCNRGQRGSGNILPVIHVIWLSGDAAGSKSNFHGSCPKMSTSWGFQGKLALQHLKYIFLHFDHQHSVNFFKEYYKFLAFPDLVSIGSIRHRSKISVNFSHQNKNTYIKKYIWKCHLQNGSHLFCSGPSVFIPTTRPRFKINFVPQRQK